MNRDASPSSPWTVHRLNTEHGTLAVAELDCAAESKSPAELDYAPDTGAQRPESSETVVVLLHGFTGSHRSWDRVARSLAVAERIRAYDVADRGHDAATGSRDSFRPARSLRILAPDLPGHGESYATGDASHFSLEATAGGLTDALSRMGVSACTLVGYSMGGRLALSMALAAPGLVSCLVLESASPGLESERDRALRREADEDLARYACDRGIEAFVDRWEQTPVLAAERSLDPATRAELRRQRTCSTVEGLAASLRGMGAGSQPWLGRRLGELRMPVLLVTGESDAKFTEIGRQMATAIPRTTHEIVANVGHNVHLAEPERFARLVGRFATDPSRPSPRAPRIVVHSSEETA
jgi:2-succinyl-6-hydroxy-2,4-cyclohexadiene-1-carboxylate synthase